MRRLTLRKETLAELTTTELTAVVGGAESKLGICPTDPCITPPPPSRLDCSFSLGPDVCG